jgi:toxin ParE1/3/4
MKWQVRLGQQAERDLDDIVARTAQRFGPQQSARYETFLEEIVEELTDGPWTLPSRSVADISEGLLSVHMAHTGRKGRHVFYFRIDASAQPPVVRIVRILHDAMDARRHLAEFDDQS